MGCYINPPKESKEEFLRREAEMIHIAPTWDEIPEGKTVICLVDNGLFTAAGEAYSKY